jgi:hypothetical protein
MRDLPAGFTKVPFGFTQDDKGLVAIISVKARNERAELAEFAIELFGLLGISEVRLEQLKGKPDPISKLRLEPKGYIPIRPELKEG